MLFLAPRLASGKCLAILVTYSTSSGHRRYLVQVLSIYCSDDLTQKVLPKSQFEVKKCTVQIESRSGQIERKTALDVESIKVSTSISLPAEKRMFFGRIHVVSIMVNEETSAGISPSNWTPTSECNSDHASYLLAENLFFVRKTPTPEDFPRIL